MCLNIPNYEIIQRIDVLVHTKLNEVLLAFPE